MTESEEDRLIKDVRKTGFPSELVAGNILETLGWNVGYNEYYLDEDEGKGREIDLNASKGIFNIGATTMVRLAMIASVKKSDKPWVVFSTKGGPAMGDPGWSRLHWSVNEISNEVLPYEELAKLSTFSAYARWGSSYYCGFGSTSGSETIFSALVSAVKASEYYIKHQADSFITQLVTEEEKYIEFIEPTVVLDGQLYEAFLDSKNELAVRRTNSVPVTFGYLSNNYRRQEPHGHYLVEIVTMEGLFEFAQKKGAWADHVQKVIENNTKSAQ